MSAFVFRVVQFTTSDRKSRVWRNPDKITCNKMPIIQLTPRQEIDGYIERQMQRVKDALIYNLMFVGERCINKARSSGGYYDRTGNLRSSVGYVITVDGEIVTGSSFRKVKDGGEGSSSGAKYAKELARQFPQGIVLIVVAGMEYAAYVSAKGYDVLDSAELLADKIVPKILKKLGFKA